MIVNYLKILSLIEKDISQDIFYKVSTEITKKEIMLSLTEDYLLNVNQIIRILFKKEIEAISSDEIEILMKFLKFCRNPSGSQEDLGLLQQISSLSKSEGQLEVFENKLISKEKNLNLSLILEPTNYLNLKVGISLFTEKSSSAYKSLGIFYSYEIPLLLFFIKEFSGILNSFNELLDSKGLKNKDELPDIFIDMGSDAEINSKLCFNFGKFTKLDIELRKTLEFLSLLNFKADSSEDRLDKKIYLKHNSKSTCIYFDNIQELASNIDNFENEYLRF